MVHFHIDLTDDRGSFQSDALAHSAGGRLMRTVPQYDGHHDLAIIEIPDDNADYLRELLESDDNVTGYREYQQDE